MTAPQARAPLASDSVHTAKLADLPTLTARVQYACEQQSPPLTTAGVRQWLDAYGYPTKTDTKDQRTYVSRIVSTWRRERGLGDTADQLDVMTPERLAELDEIAGRASHPGNPGDPGEPVTEPTPPALPEIPATAPAPAAKPQRPRGAALFYVVAVVATLVSVDTSWRFFGDVLGITDDWERAIMFGVVELALVACGYAMRANVRRDGSPGAARTLAWALCATAGYMAFALSGPVQGIARVVLGPVLALVALHLALGIEVRAHRGARTGTWARIGRELRERILSRLGLADDARDALARTRDRAADRAARLATARRAPFQRRRLGRAVRASGAALDARQRERVLTQVAALRHLDDLVTADQPSPWRN